MDCKINKKFRRIKKTIKKMSYNCDLYLFLSSLCCNFRTFANPNVSIYFYMYLVWL